ncbi:50S ribosomal protein L31 [Candidatus Mycoplasma pogonae]
MKGIVMKKEIHPEYKEIKVTCSTCSNEHVFGSTASNVSVDACSKCHSFYTGDKSMAKATGRVERFKRIMEKSSTKTTK